MNKFLGVALAFGVIAVIAVGSWALVAMPDGSRDASGQTGDQTQQDTPRAKGGRQVYHLEVDGTRREFLVYRPVNVSPEQELPVVFAFHGSGGNGPNFYESTGWKDKADDEGFMVVYPTGLKYHIFDEFRDEDGLARTTASVYQTKWNSFELPSLLDPEYADQVPADDLQFTQDMLAFLDEQYAIDTERMYVTGFSNGAQMATRLMTEMSDVFAAFGPVSGGITPEGVIEGVEDQGVEVTPRPILQVFGQRDPRLTSRVGVSALPLDESLLDADNAAYDLLIQNNLIIEGIEDDGTYERRDAAAVYTYTGTDGQEAYQIIIIENMGHVYPNGENVPFDVTDILWPFFVEHSR